VLDEQSWALLRRLTRWLDQFKSCFGHQAQRVSLREYLHGLLGDSPRKSMQAMLARVTEPRSYQAFQHFITHAPWDATCVWRRLLALVPDRRGVLLLDDTPFLKQGQASVGVARQYASRRHHITNCQVAVTAALWTRQRGWFVGADLYLPEAWLTPERRAQARIPQTRRFEEKWRLALRLIRRVRAAGLAIEAVVADAGYGNIAALRTALDRLRLPYVLAIASDITAFRGTPRLRPPARHPGAGRPGRRPRLAPATRWFTVADIAAALPASAWRRVTWCNGTNPRLRAEFAAVRVTPVVYWRQHAELHEVWLLCERRGPTAPVQRYYLSNLPAATPVARLARLAHCRWAVEQQYRELKTDLGIDHFEGRTYPGWHHHVVLTALAYAFLQKERLRRAAGPTLTLPQVRAMAHEVFTALILITRPRYYASLERARRRYMQLRI
jgi:SRSO17 transposase